MLSVFTPSYASREGCMYRRRRSEVADAREARAPTDWRQGVISALRLSSAVVRPVPGHGLFSQRKKNPSRRFDATAFPGDIEERKSKPRTFCPSSNSLTNARKIQRCRILKPDISMPRVSFMKISPPISCVPVSRRRGHLMLLVSNEKDDGNAMLALRPNGSQSSEGSRSWVIDMPCCCCCCCWGCPGTAFCSIGPVVAGLICC